MATFAQGEAVQTCESLGYKRYDVYMGIDIPFDKLPIPGMLVYQDNQGRLWEVTPKGEIMIVSKQEIEYERASIIKHIAGNPGVQPEGSRSNRAVSVSKGKGKRPGTKRRAKTSRN